MHAKYYVYIVVISPPLPSLAEVRREGSFMLTHDTK
jgi:hypothetical protein